MGWHLIYKATIHLYILLIAYIGIFFFQLVTFDQYGVSGHTNHAAIFKTVKKLKEDERLTNLGRNVSVYTLKSVNLFRKYISVLDIIFSIFARYAELKRYVNVLRRTQCFTQKLRVQFFIIKTEVVGLVV